MKREKVFPNILLFSFGNNCQNIYIPTDLPELFRGGGGCSFDYQGMTISFCPDSCMKVRCILKLKFKLKYLQKKLEKFQRLDISGC